MKSQGWVKLYRQILDNPIVCKDSDYFSVWCYLILNATHSEYDVVFNKERITLKPGQLITGRKAIADKFKVNESKVTRILKKLENEQQIEQQTCNKNRLISILNWEQYQESEQQNEQQLNNKRTTTEQQLNTNKNVNNINNDKNENKSNISEQCELIWKLYPNKKGKVNAMKNIPKIIKKYGFEILKKSVLCYVQEVKGKDKQYILHGSTFFNGRYEDYLNQEIQESKPKVKSTTHATDVPDFLKGVM